METIYTPQGDGNIGFIRQSVECKETIYTPQGDGNVQPEMAQYLCPMETIYTPQGDGNPSLSEVQPYLRRKQSTPRKGTETYEEGTEIAEWNAKQSTPRKGTETNMILSIFQIV